MGWRSSLDLLLTVFTTCAIKGQGKGKTSDTRVVILCLGGLINRIYHNAESYDILTFSILQSDSKLDFSHLCHII